MYEVIEQIMDKIIATFKSSSFRAHAALLESLITIILHVSKEEFTPFIDRFIPVLLDQVASTDWNTQKVGIDAICAITMQMPDEIIRHRISIL